MKGIYVGVKCEKDELQVLEDLAEQYDSYEEVSFKIPKRSKVFNVEGQTKIPPNLRAYFGFGSNHADSIQFQQQVTDAGYPVNARLSISPPEDQGTLRRYPRHRHNGLRQRRAGGGGDEARRL